MTRMSGDQKEKVVQKTAEEERAHIRAMRNMALDELGEEKRSESSTDEEASSSDSETGKRFTNRVSLWMGFITQRKVCIHTLRPIGNIRGSWKFDTPTKDISCGYNVLYGTCLTKVMCNSFRLKF